MNDHVILIGVKLPELRREEEECKQSERTDNRHVPSPMSVLDPFNLISKAASGCLPCPKVIYANETSPSINGVSHISTLCTCACEYV